MQQIADVAGVSRMTVSLALRQSGEISASERTRIQNLAEKMGYRPNPLVSTLMAARARGKGSVASHPMALLDLHRDTSWIRQGEFYRDLIEGVKTRADALGFCAEIFSPPTRNAAGMAILHRIFWTRNIRGIVVLPAPTRFPAPPFPWEHYGSATIGHSLAAPSMNTASSDQYGNALMLFQHLFDLGYRRPGLFLSTETEIRTRYHASAALHTHCRIHPDTEELDCLSIGAEKSEAVFRRWLKSQKPDVLVSNKSHLGFLRTLGCSIPAKIGYAVLNRDQSDNHLSGIDLMPKQIGAAAVDLVVARLHRNEFGLPAHPASLMVSGMWRVGTTTRPQ